jgi:hypothetical protein
MAWTKGAVMKYTPWFKPDVLPVHEGVYEAEPDPYWPGPWFRKFAGGKWHRGSPMPAYAAESRNPLIEKYMKDRWRGLAKEPK